MPVQRIHQNTCEGLSSADTCARFDFVLTATTSGDLWWLSTTNLEWTLMTSAEGVQGTPPREREGHFMLTVGTDLLIHGGSGFGARDGEMNALLLAL